MAKRRRRKQRRDEEIDVQESDNSGIDPNARDDDEEREEGDETNQKRNFSMERAYQGEPELDADDEDKGSYVLARYGCQNDHYIGLQRTWTKPIFFLVGKHHVTWDEFLNVWTDDVDVPEWRQQPVTNLVYAALRTAVAKLTKNRPIQEVVGPSGDSEDKDAAKLAEAILDHLFRVLKKPSKVKRALGWLLCTGQVYFNTGWDPDAGETRPRTVLVEAPHPDDPQQTIDLPVASDEDGEPYTDDDGKVDYEREPDEEAIGEVTFDIDDPICTRFNPDCIDPEEAEEWFVAKLWPRASAAKYFDIPESDLKSETPDDDGDREDIEDALSAVSAAAPDPFTNRVERTGTSQRDAIGERVLVIEYYRKPSAADGYPKGRHWINIGPDKVWPKPDDAQYPNGEAPVPFKFWPPRVPLIDTPIPGQPQAIGILGQAVTLNEKYNFVDAKIGEFHVMMAMGGVIWVAPEDAGIQVTSEPGQVKVSKGLANGHPPVREKLEGLPAPIYQEREVIMNAFRTVVGLSEVDFSQRPEGVTAGRAFLVLQEASDAPLQPLIEAFETAMAEVARRELVIVQQKYSEERTIKIRGTKGSYEYRSFMGADLPEGLDVRVVTGSSFPWSKSAQFDTKLSILTALPQLVMKPDGSVDKEQLSRFLDPAGTGLQSFESEEDPDLVEIDNEHAIFEAFQGKPGQILPEVAFWQNHAVHQEQHFNFMKRDFARFKRWDPMAQLAFMEHMRLTTDAVAQLAAMAVQAANPGAGDEGASGGGEPAPDVGITPGGGVAGSENTPRARKKQSQLQLTKADRAAAGQ